MQAREGQHSMGDGGITIDVGDALPYLEERFWGLFGKDQASIELAAWFKGIQTTALRQTHSVQCLGMRSPLPFDRIYQPTRLRVGPDLEALEKVSSFASADRVSRSILRGRSFDERSITIREFLERDHDAIILSGPGWGKTTFLHHVYRSTLNSRELLPVLITLRRPTALQDLERYVSTCDRIQKRHHRACTLLLVDGYDEISVEERRKVSDLLLKYQAHRAGKFYLTCREFYQVSQLKVPEVRIEAFNRDDQMRFSEIFLKAFELRDDPETVIGQLENRGFAEFLSHPLLLTLACIVRASSSTAQPRSGLRLLQRALDVLCYQWDEQKHIDRQATTPLDGQDRLQILKYIAFKAKSPSVQQQRAEENARKQLNLLGMDRVDPRMALMEIAKFYGILVPSEDGYEFVHRTVHDFLAARYWVESGDFAKESKYEFNARTGYAACLMSDSTEVFKRALASPDGLPAATEIISNSASFDMRSIAEALVMYFSVPGRIVFYEESGVNTSHKKIECKLEPDFLRLANSRFLDFMVEYCCAKRSRTNDVVVAYSLTELHERRLKLSFQTYSKTLATYESERTTFHVPGARQVMLEFLNPVLKNRLTAQGEPWAG